MNFRSAVFMLLFCTLVPSSLLMAQQQQQSAEEEKVYTERIVVTERRLPGEAQDLKRVPASAIIISREDIQSSSAVTIQDLLAEYAGMIVYDNVGNAVQKTVGMRGFSSGSAMSVLVDGVRINEPNDNAVNLEFIDLSAVERIEVIPGGAAASRGNGAIAGSINIIMRDGADRPRAKAGVSGGSWETFGAEAEAVGTAGNARYFLRGTFGESEGFRENSDYTTSSLTGSVTLDATEDWRIKANLRAFDGDFGNPGALTAAELAEDRTASPFNSLDFTESSEQVLSARIDGTPTEQLTVTALGWYRSAVVEVLTTGRSAAIFGGFASRQENTSAGLTLQALIATDNHALKPAFSVGLDVVDDQFDNTSTFTDALGNNTFPGGERQTGQQTLSIFADASLTLAPGLTLDGAVRYDSVDLDFQDRLNLAEGTTDFSETTAAVGATAQLSRYGSLYGRFSQSFQTPTVIDLFAFPLFGSNPDLQPVTGDTWEAGLRYGDQQYFFQAALYRMDLENEIIFVITNPDFFIGENRNVGESRRSGLEARGQADLGSGLSIRAGYTWTKAENLSDSSVVGGGNRELLIPLVPKHNATATVRWHQQAFSLSWNAVYVGEQVMSSDNANLGPMLDSYSVQHLAAAWDAATWGARLHLRNLFDQEYSTRAIFSGGRPFFTPAPQRNFSFTVWLRF